MSGRDICDFCKKKSLARKECDVFLELGSFQQNDSEATTRDIILVDKVTVYSLCAQLIVNSYAHSKELMIVS